MGKNQDPGYGINIPDPLHCFFHTVFVIDDKDPAIFLLFLLDDRRIRTLEDKKLLFHPKDLDPDLQH
jgi:hypothetical protein